jgi:hypothetical protein
VPRADGEAHHREEGQQRCREDAVVPLDPHPQVGRGVPTAQEEDAGDLHQHEPAQRIEAQPGVGCMGGRRGHREEGEHDLTGADRREDPGPPPVRGHREREDRAEERDEHEGEQHFSPSAC